MRLAIAITVLAFAWILSACTSDEAQSQNKTQEADPTETSSEPTPQTYQINEPIEVPLPLLPDWKAKDLDGVLRASTEWFGKKPVVVNFWGTWCPPCRREIPDLVRIYEEYKPKGVEIVGIAVRDRPDRVRTYVERANMTWVQLIANQRVIDEHNLGTSVPTTIFFDANGKEIGRFVGARNYDMFRRAFEAII